MIRMLEANDFSFARTDHIGEVYKVESESSPGKFYEVRRNLQPDPSKAWSQYRISCQCPGWTRRSDRICKHVVTLQRLLKEKVQIALKNESPEIVRRVVREVTDQGVIQGRVAALMDLLKAK